MNMLPDQGKNRYTKRHDTLGPIVLCTESRDIRVFNVSKTASSMNYVIVYYLFTNPTRVDFEQDFNYVIYQTIKKNMFFI